jgi:hypothetical protein
MEFSARYCVRALIVSFGLTVGACGDDGGGGDTDAGSTGDATTTSTTAPTTDATTSSTTDPSTSSTTDPSTSSTTDDSGSTSGTGTGTGTETGTGSTGGVDCASLDETGCGEEALCTEIYGNEILDMATDCWSSNDTFIGCRDAGDVCNDTDTFSCDGSEVPTSYRTADDCIPDGWTTDSMMCPLIDPAPTAECPPV